MHETYIARNILGIAEGHCLRAGCSRIESVSIALGGAAGVTADALRFSFDASKSGTMAEGAALIIDEVPLGGRCRACGEDFTTGEAFIFFCPNCGRPELDIDRGRELHVTGIEAS